MRHSRLFALALVLACGDITRTTGSNGPAVIEKVGSDPVGLIAGSHYDSLRVRVLDAKGAPVKGVVVSFTATLPSWIVPIATPQTDSAGMAAVRWKTGDPVGTNTAAATVAGLAPVTFATTTVVGPPARLRFTGPAQNGLGQPGPFPSLSEFAASVAVTDAVGNFDSTATPEIEIKLWLDEFNPKVASAKLTGIATKQAVKGIAVFDHLTLDLALDYRIDAYWDGIRKASTAVSITPGPATKLTFGTAPADYFAACPMKTPFTVEIQDVVGNLVPRSDPISLSIADNPGGATLSGVTTVQASSGVATFAGIVVSKPGAAYALSAATPGLAAATSTSFGMTATEGCWTQGESLAVPRTTPGLVSDGNRIWAIGGYTSLSVPDVDSYDPGTKKWTSRPRLPTRRHRFGIASVDGVIYAIGGRRDSLIGFNPTSSLTAVHESFDTAANVWSVRAPMPTPRYNLGVAAVNGVIYAIGGQQFFANLRAVEAFDIATGQWTTRNEMPAARGAILVAVLGGKIYVLEQGTGLLDAYDPVADSWTSKAPMPNPHFPFAISASRGLLYVFGATAANAGNTGAVVKSYDPSLDQWTDRMPIPTPIFLPAAADLGSIIHVVGGAHWYYSLLPP